MEVSGERKTMHQFVLEFIVNVVCVGAGRKDGVGLTCFPQLVI